MKSTEAGAGSGAPARRGWTPLALAALMPLVFLGGGHAGLLPTLLGTPTLLAPGRPAAGERGLR